jgi:hypothetical protein
MNPVQVNVGLLITTAGYLSVLYALTTLVVLKLNQKTLSKDLKFNFFKILMISMAGSSVPIGLLGMVVGFPAILFTSVLLTLVFRKELS